jgi:flavin-dependent dehydrogenase
MPTTPTTRSTFDLAVIGGGPAGASAAITAARAGASVLLLERGKLARQRVCGEFVSAASLTLQGDLLNSPGLLEQALRPKPAFFVDHVATIQSTPSREHQN